MSKFELSIKFSLALFSQGLILLPWFCSSISVGTNRSQSVLVLLFWAAQLTQTHQLVGHKSHFMSCNFVSDCASDCQYSLCLKDYPLPWCQLIDFIAVSNLLLSS